MYGKHLRNQVNKAPLSRFRLLKFVLYVSVRLPNQQIVETATLCKFENNIRVNAGGKVQTELVFSSQPLVDWQ